MRVIIPTVLLLMVSTGAARAETETLQVLGQAGVLGEWELTAAVSATVSGAQKTFSGTLLMKHVGMCSVDGPEQKTGELQLQLVGSSRITATLVVDGATCTYAGRKTDNYTGLLRCPERRDVPLLLWLK